MKRKLQCRLDLAFANETVAKQAEAALKADDDAFVTTRRTDAHVHVELQADDVGGLLRALDDVLAQWSVFEDLIRAAPGASPRA